MNEKKCQCTCGNDYFEELREDLNALADKYEGLIEVYEFGFALCKFGTIITMGGSPSNEAGLSMIMTFQMEQIQMALEIHHDRRKMEHSTEN